MGEGQILDHLVGYKAKTRRASPFNPISVNLNDQFDSGSFRVIRPVRFYNPAQKFFDGGVTDINDDQIHLTGYSIRTLQIFETYQQIRQVEVINQFGQMLVEVGDPDMLLVPSTKNDEFDPQRQSEIFGTAHFKCYDIKVLETTVDLIADTGSPVSVSTQFDPEPYDVNVIKPDRLCTPAEKQHLGPPFTPEVLPPDDHLMCYAINVAHRNIRRVEVNNQFSQPQTFLVNKERQLCVPSQKLIL